MIIIYERILSKHTNSTMTLIMYYRQKVFEHICGFTQYKMYYLFIYDCRAHKKSLKQMTVTVAILNPKQRKLLGVMSSSNAYSKFKLNHIIHNFCLGIQLKWQEIQVIQKSLVTYPSFKIHL